MGKAPPFQLVSATHSEALLVTKDTGVLYQWPSDHDSARPYPLTDQLKLVHGGIRLLKSSDIRTTLVLDTGEIATFYDPLLRGYCTRTHTRTHTSVHQSALMLSSAHRPITPTLCFPYPSPSPPSPPSAFPTPSHILPNCLPFPQSVSLTLPPPSSDFPLLPPISLSSSHPSPLPPLSNPDSSSPQSPQLIAELTHPAQLFAGLRPPHDKAESLAVGDFLSMAITTSGKTYWW